jgi:hypothetical protein
MSVVVPGICVSCGASEPGPFCEQCGDKRISHHDYSIGHFLIYGASARLRRRPPGGGAPGSGARRLWLPTLETYRLLLFLITLRLMH